MWVAHAAGPPRPSTRHAIDVIIRAAASLASIAAAACICAHRHRSRTKITVNYFKGTAAGSCCVVARRTRGTEAAGTTPHAIRIGTVGTATARPFTAIAVGALRVGAAYCTRNKLRIAAGRL